MKAKRLCFAKKHAHWTGEEWSKVLFSDESYIRQFVSRKTHVRRPIGERYVERYTKPTIKHPPSLMIWSAMSVNGTARLFALTWHDHEQSKIVGITEGQGSIAHGGQKLSSYY